MTAQFHFVGIVVADMAASLAFYRRLGLDIPAGADGEQHDEAVIGDGHSLVWDTAELIHSFDPDWAPPSGGPRIALGFRCASPEEVDRRYAELTAAGYQGHKAPWDAFWGQRYATLRDPDGNSVDLLAPLTPTG